MKGARPTQHNVAQPLRLRSSEKSYRKELPPPLMTTTIIISIIIIMIIIIIRAPQGNMWHARPGVTCATRGVTV